MVSTCSRCETNTLITPYLQGDWTHTQSQDDGIQKLYSCKHAKAVVSWLSYKVIPSYRLPPEYSTSYSHEIAGLLKEYLSGFPISITPGAWILTEVKHQTKKGELVFYLSEHEGVLIFCKSQNTGGRKRLICCLCSKPRLCSHLALTTDLESENLPVQPNSETINDSNGELQDILISKGRYPFDLDTDPELREIIRQRSVVYIGEWLDSYAPFIAEQRTCCGEECQRTKATGNKKEIEVYLY